MDVVQPVDPGSPGGPPPPPGGEPIAPARHSATTIHGFLAVVRRRLLLEAALRTVGYGIGILGAVVLLLALIATNVGPAAFWPAVTVGVLGTFAVVAMIAGVWRPAWAMRQDRAAARRAGALMPSMASDLLSAVELAEPREPDPRAASVSVGLVQAFQDYVGRSVAPVDARQLVSLRPAVRALATAAVPSALAVTRGQNDAGPIAAAASASSASAAHSNAVL